MSLHYVHDVDKYSFWGFSVVLVFSKCFRAGYFTFSQLKFKVNKGIKLMKFMLQNKDKDLLGIYQCGYDPFCLSLLTDRHLKVRCHTDFV